MADNTELNTGSGGDIIATDEVSGVKHQRVKVEYGADGSATDVSPSTPLPVERVLADPKSSHATSAGVAAGGTADLDSSDITNGKTGKLVAILASSSVQLKCVLKKVASDVPGAVLATWFVRGGDLRLVEFPDRAFFAQAGGANCHFRVEATNLDTSQASDPYATFFWDEV